MIVSAATYQEENIRQLIIKKFNPHVINPPIVDIIENSLIIVINTYRNIIFGTPHNRSIETYPNFDIFIIFICNLFKNLLKILINLKMHHKIIQ
jgi:hypothetical protein